MSFILPLSLTYSGTYTLRKIRRGVCTGERTIHNLILTSGYDLIGSSSDCFIKQCFVGTGETPPTLADTTLETLMASSDVQDNTGSNSVITSPTRYNRYLVTFTFTAGSITAPITEIGCGVSSTSLFSRALLLDSSGVIAPLEILSDESLEVIYELRANLPDGDVTGTFSSFNNATQLTTNILITIRVAQITNSLQIQFGLRKSSSAKINLYDGDIRAETTIPGGSAAGEATLDPSTYVAGQFDTTFSYNYSYSYANWATGIKAFTMKTTQCFYQIGLSAPIIKGSRDYMKFALTIYWGP